MPQFITITGEHLTLDLILFRRFGTKGNSLIAETLKLNPGLAEKGVILPFGYKLILPELPKASEQPTTAVSLFS